MAEQQKMEDREPEESRRGFLNKLWAALGLVVLAELVWLVVSFLRPRKPGTKQGDYGTRFPEGAILSCPPGGRGLPGDLPEMHPPGVHGPLGGRRQAICLSLSRLDL